MTDDMKKKNHAALHIWRLGGTSMSEWPHC